MRDYIIEAGWGIFPVLFTGVIAVAVSLAFAISLRRELLPVFATFWVASLLSGALGTVVGFERVLEAVASKTSIEPKLLIDGTRESLHCFAAAIRLTTIAVLIGGVGVFRVAWRQAAKG